MAKYIDIYCDDLWLRLMESGGPGVTSGILQDADCIVIERKNGMAEYLM